jgi:hypothetical protein
MLGAAAWGMAVVLASWASGVASGWTTAGAPGLVSGGLSAGDVVARAIEPSSYAPGAGERVELRLAGAGEGWGRERVEWMYVRVAGMQRNMDSPELDAQGRLFVSSGAGGVGLVGVDLHRREEETDLRALRGFVAQRGRVAGELPPGDGPLRLDRVESFKAVLRIGAPEAAAGASAATSKTGQRVEIRLLMDPSVSSPGSDVAVRAYVNGSGASGARVIATHASSGVVREVRCDGSGIGHFGLHAGGAWRVEMHELRREEERWVLYSGAVTFEVPVVEGRGR